MSKQFLKDALSWGFVLWLIGYALGFILFAFVPAFLIGWFIMPIGTVITILIAFKKIKGTTLQYFLAVAAVWTMIAVVFDYFFLVKVLNPAGGYYKLDVYIYYILTFVIPMIAGLVKTRQAPKA